MLAQTRTLVQTGKTRIYGPGYDAKNPRRTRDFDITLNPTVAHFLISRVADTLHAYNTHAHTHTHSRRARVSA